MSHPERELSPRQNQAFQSQLLQQSQQQLTLNQYQQLALTTAMYPDKGKQNHNGMNYTILKLNGEAGEVAEKWGKCLRGDYPIATAKEMLRWEIGDVLWYIAALASEMGMTLEQVAEANLEKLKDRKSRGKIQGNGDTR